MEGKVTVAMDMSKARKVNQKTELEIPSDEQNQISMEKRSMMEWKNVNWRELEKRVFKLQKKDLPSL